MATDAVLEQEPVDADVVEEPDAPPPSIPASTELVPRGTLTVAPQVAAEELGKRLAVIKQAMENEMTPGVDYGVIPGTNSKPTLLKPGAEKLSVLFQLDVQLDNEKAWGPGEHLTVISHATVFHAVTGIRLGYGEGLCSTREKKYAYRRGELTCPECGVVAVYKSKKADEPGFYCWRKKDGCGVKFTPDDTRITSQDVGRLDNPDLPDEWNTVIKMAEKRARIDAVLAVTGASALFTQDVEDKANANGNGETESPAADPHGEPIKKSMVPHMKAAILKVVGGDTAAAHALHDQIIAKTGGVFRQASASAVVLASKALTESPLNPVYEPDKDGDVPSEAQVQREQRRAQRQAVEVSPEAINQKRDEVKRAWQVAGLSAAAAQAEVDNCRDRWDALVRSEQQAGEQFARKEALST